MKIHKTVITTMTLAFALGAQASPEKLAERATNAAMVDATMVKTPGAFFDQTELGSVLFDSDSVEIDQRLWPFLVSTAVLAAANESLIVALEGYADVRGSRNHNFTLSHQRVRAVAEFLIRHGVKPAQIAGTGFGEIRAQANVQDVKGQIFDRRVNVSLGRRDTPA